uniref:uncharacterized protein n=1 Tax=Semicossyphus pulcher TaxID=241346 RepID=UPI0037E72D42
MNPQNNNVPGIPAVKRRGKRKRHQIERIPLGYKEAMKFLSVKLAGYSNRRSGYDPKLQRREGPIAFKWKSSFKALDGAEEGTSEEKISSSPKKEELYNPYDPASSDSEPEMPQAQDHNQSNLAEDQESQSLSPGRGCSRWDSSILRPGSRPLNRIDLSTETTPNESQNLSPGHSLPDQRAYSPDPESIDLTGYGSISVPLDHRVCSPDRAIPGSSTQPFPASYGEQRTNGEERITVPEYRREVSPEGEMTTVRLSPPRLKQDYQQQLEYVEKDLDQISPSGKMTRLGNKNIAMDQNPITCDLCDVEFANGQELEDHLESKSHWDTLEHIQQGNNYDDIIIAFLQDVMLYKSRQCSRAIDDCALQALQENDHMTKIELFQCAACKIFVSTSAASVQTHITSKEHLINTQEFEAQQRQTCLDTAEILMKALKPQFEHFLQGRSPFE